MYVGVVPLPFAAGFMAALEAEVGYVVFPLQECFLSNRANLLQYGVRLPQRPS